MGRNRRNCPVLGCGSTNLARLANHLHQVHHMDIEERSKWLKWSKMGMCVPYLQTQKTVTGDRQSNLEETLAKLLKHQEKIEKKICNYVREVNSDVDSRHKQKPVCAYSFQDRETTNVNNGQQWLPFDI